MRPYMKKRSKRSLSFKHLFAFTFVGISIAVVSNHEINKRSNDGFTTSAITPHRPYNPSFDTRALSDAEKNELLAALDQPFSYHGCGGQSFIFFSHDGRYALKLFKQSKFTTPFWIQHFPIPWMIGKYRNKKIESRKDKIERDFASYKIAFEELPQETGVVYIHLNPTSHLQKKLTLIDKRGKSHRVDLDSIDFVVQKKADLVYDRISLLMEQKEIDKAQKAIDSIVDLIVSRCERGYHDRDPNVRTNCGFLGERAIKIDVGRLMHDESVKEPARIKQELLRITSPFQTWLSQNHPELTEHLNTKVESALHSLTQDEKHHDHAR